MPIYQQTRIVTDSQGKHYFKYKNENYAFGERLDHNDPTQRTLIPGLNKHVIKLPRQKANLELYPITLVNLLGKYGNFETDSNEDGLADGWVSGNEYSVVSGIIGSSAQLFRLDNTGGTSTIWNQATFDRNINAALNDVFFFGGFIKSGPNNTSPYDIRFPRLVLYDINQTQISLFEKRVTAISSWQLVYMTATISQSQAVYVQMKPTHPTDAGDISEYILDGLFLYNLSKMGDLPAPLQQFFASAGVTKWTDLATTSNITGADGRTQTGEDWLAELLPYVDSVATVGYSWTDGQLTVTVENRGKNIFKLTSNLQKRDPSKSFEWFIEGNKLHILNGAPGYGITGTGKTFNLNGLIYEILPLKPGKEYTVSIQASSSSNIVLIIRDISNTTYAQISDSSVTFTAPNVPVGWCIALINSPSSDEWIQGIKIEESSTASEYKPTRSDKVEISNIELYGYNSVYDKLTGTTTLKNWQRDTDISISAGRGTVTKSGTGTCIFVNQSDGLTYHGRASGTTVEGPTSTVTEETPSGTVDGTNKSFNTLNTPIKPGTLSITVDDTTNITDNGDGTLSDGGTVDYATGNYTLATAPTTSITNDYTYYTDPPDGTYTVIYQLTTPENITVNETFLYTTEEINYIVLPEQLCGYLNLSNNLDYIRDTLAFRR